MLTEANICRGKISGRAAIKTLATFTWFCLTGSLLYSQPSPFPDSKFWIADGPVNAVLATNNTLYLGGDFFYVGPRTGPAAVFSQSTGQLLNSPPQIKGVIKAIVPDGFGGWYIGGTFTSIGNIAITNLAHLGANLVVDTGWNAKVAGIAVNALVVNSNRLYAGGSFTRVNGQANSLGLVGLSTVDASMVWNPQLSGTVNALVLSSNLVYAGGNFFSVGSSNTANLAAITTDNSALATAWNPAPDQPVFALQLSGNLMYVGGQFTSIGTKSRNRLAAVDTTTAVANSWNPNPNGIVRALAITATNAYIGGDFTSISIVNRRGFASFGLTGAGTAQPLDLQLQSLGTVNLVGSILLQGNSLYVGGQFTNALGAPYTLVVGIDSTTGLAIPVPLGSSFNGTAGAAFPVNTMVAAGGKVLVGGDFQSLGGVPRQHAAALSLTTGSALPWAPTFDGSVFSLAYGTNRIYVGGNFTNAYNTNFVNGLAALDPVSGNVLPFSFLGTNGSSPISVNALAVGSGSLYVGGAFTVVGNQSRKSLASVDLNSGAVISTFNANLAGGFAGVNSLLLRGTNLYVAGDFSTVSSLAIPRLAAVSSSDGSPQSWTPAPNQAVTAMAASSDTLYVGGAFATISGGITLRGFAAFSLADNSLLPIDATLPAFSTVSALGADSTVVYVGGAFTAAGGEFRQNLASLSSADGSAFDWNPSPDVGPTTMALTADLAIVGGPLRTLGQSPTNQPNGFLAVFPRAPQFLSSTVTSPGTVRLVTTTGDRTETVLQSSPSVGSPVWTSIATNSGSVGFSWTMDVSVTCAPAILPRVCKIATVSPYRVPLGCVSYAKFSEPASLPRRSDRRSLDALDLSQRQFPNASSARISGRRLFQPSRTAKSFRPLPWQTTTSSCETLSAS